MFDNELVQDILNQILDATQKVPGCHGPLRDKTVTFNLRY